MKSVYCLLLIETPGTELASNIMPVGRLLSYFLVFSDQLISQFYVFFILVNSILQERWEGVSQPARVFPLQKYFMICYKAAKTGVIL